MTNPRAVALQCLARYRRYRDGDDFLRQAVLALPRRDRALCERIVFSVLQNQRRIDDVLSNFSKKLNPIAADILRIGAAQFWYTDRIPRHAVVSESVVLAQKYIPFAAGMVNAVLRKLPDCPPHTENLALRTSLPDWFVAEMTGVLPRDQLEPFCLACNTPPPLFLHHIGNGKPASEHITPFEPLDGCYTLDDPLYLKKHLNNFIVADVGARLCVEALAPQPGDDIWDVCAAPGGKSALIAHKLGGIGSLLATDVSANRLKQMRHFPHLTMRAADGTDFNPRTIFDAVLCDVPCSGFGTLRRKPDIRRKTLESLRALPQLQAAILQNAAKFVKPSGTLLYSTCTVRPQENEDVVEQFLDAHPTFTREAFSVPIAGDVPNGQITLYPHIHATDGFFICKMRKGE